ncbi:MAG: SBBP repeat-containing protein [Chitinophagaceae bacterium]|nr:SBBP repeat-containing protein [Chitinophagaceae bacterium]
MKKTSLTVLCAFLCILLQAQFNYQWAKKINTQTNSHDVTPMSTAVDSKGNVYTVGSFNGKVNFDPSFVLNPAAILTAKIEPNAQGSILFNTDVFVTKFDANGNFKWVKQWGSTGGDMGLSIAIDASDNIYTTGNCSGPVDFDPSPNKSFILNNSQYTTFISKLDADGNFKWAKRIDGSSRGYSIAVDANANVYATGWVYDNSSTDFDPGAGSAVAKDGNIYVLKLNSSGTFQWVKGFGGLQNSPSLTTALYHIAVDQAGNAYTTGRFINTGDFDPGIAVKNLTAKGANDIFVSKLNSAGNFVWIKQLGGSGNDLSNSIAVLNDRVYITGTFTGTGSFDPNSDNKNLTSAGGNDIFITKLNADGGFKWARRIGGIGNDCANEIIVDQENNVYTTGNFEGEVDFNPKAGDNNKFFLTSKGSRDIFLSKLSAGEGEFMFAKQIGGIGYDVANAFCLSTDKRIHVVGNFSNTVDFDPNEGVKNLTSLNGNISNGHSMFIAKYNQMPVIVPLPGELVFPEINAKQGNINIPTSGKIDFGTVAINTNKDIVVTIQNTGTAKLNLNSIEIAGDFIKTGVAHANVVNPGASVNLTVRMKATNTPGLKMGTLTITNNDLDASTYIINLVGEVEDMIEKALPDEPQQSSAVNAPVKLQAISTAYPNPTNQGWKITLKQDVGNSNYSLINRQGSVVSTGVIRANNFYVAAQNLPAGMYFLRINNTKIDGVIQLIKE